MGKYEELKDLPYTKKVIDFIVDTQYEDIPEEVIERAKGRILDCIGVAYSGGVESCGKVIKDFVREFGTGKPEATVVGANMRTDVMNASFANGILMDAIDYNDHFLLSHPSVCVVPALLPVAEMVGATGKEILTAFVVGLEIYTKINQAMTTEPWYNGFHATGIWGTVGAVAVSGKLLKLDKEQMLMAWGLACSTFAGLKRNVGVHAKPFHVGRSVEGGVRSALLGSIGFTSHIGAFEMAEGYMDVFTKHPKWEFVEQLGEKWDLIEFPTCIKPHPSCGTTHAPMDGMMKIVTEHPEIKTEDVARIDVGSTRGGSFKMFFPEPRDIYEAKFSIHFCVALVLYYRDWGLRYHTQESVDNPEIQRLCKLVNHYMDEELDARVDPDLADYYAIVTVTMKDGTVYRVQGEPPRLTYDQIKEKFYDSTCNINRMTRKHADQIVEMIRNLEEFEINDLVPLIR